MAENYPVGKYKPPKHSQFKKGQSGNPKGRPKGAVNLTTALKLELARELKVRGEDGKVEMMPAAQVAIRSSILKAINRDIPAFREVMSLAAKAGFFPPEPPPRQAGELTDIELAVIRSLSGQIDEGNDDEA